MRLHRFYTDNLVPDTGQFAYTNTDHIHQWVRVFRYGVGDHVLLFDGNNMDIECSIISLEKNSVELEVVQSMRSPAGLRTSTLEVCFSMLKGSATDFVLEKLVELGVTQITPLVTTHAERRELNLKRAEKIIVEACEQSGWGSIPALSPVTELGQSLESAQRAVVFEHTAPTRAKGFDFSNTEKIYIGPEGGWSESEKEQFRKKGVTTIALTTSALRAETAAIAAVSKVLF